LRHKYEGEGVHGCVWEWWYSNERGRGVSHRSTEAEPYDLDYANNILPITIINLVAARTRSGVRLVD